MKTYRIVYQRHAVERMAQRGISEEEVTCALSAGATIKEYPHDTPYPSKLLLYWSGSRPVHIVVAINEIDSEKIIVTVYEPDSGQWESNFRRRRQ